MTPDRKRILKIMEHRFVIAATEDLLQRTGDKRGEIEASVLLASIGVGVRVAFQELLDHLDES